MTQYVTLEALRAIGASKIRADVCLPHIQAACNLYDINTPARVAAFLAQIGHESGGLTYTTEIWGPTPAQQTYEGRKGLGNTQPGDGERFKGHGFIQTTGRYNHAQVRDRLRKKLGDHVPDFEAEPEKLAELEWAALSAADYWDMKSLNDLADADDFEGITRRINGGFNGLADRLDRWSRVKAVIASTEPAPVVERSTVAQDDTSPEPVAEPPLVQLEQTEPEKPMTPFIAAVLPSLIDLVPKLGTIFSSGSEKSERNIKAAQVVVDAAKSAIGAANEQELAEKLQADPLAAETVKRAIEAKWYEVAEVGGGVQAARVADERRQSGPGFWQSGAFWITAMLLPLVYMALYATLFREGASDEIKAMVLGAIFGGLLTGGITAFWFGTSASSQRKTDALASQR